MSNRLGQEMARMIEQALQKLFSDGIPGYTISGQIPGTTVAPATGDTPGTVALSDDAPANVGSASAGASGEVSRADHVHNLPNTAVTAGSYGDGTHVGAFTVDAKGRLTAAASVAISVTASGAAGGDLNGTYPNPTVDGLQGHAVGNTAPALADRLRWSGSAWQPSALRWEPVASAGELVFDGSGDVIMAEV